MFFYRIENENGCGVYEANVGNIAAKYSDAPLHMQADPTRVFKQFSKENPNRLEWHFGFPTLENLYSWFNTFESIAYMKHRNCRILKYKIDGRKVKIEGNQLIFKKEDAVFVEFIEFDYKQTKWREVSIFTEYSFVSRQFRDYLKNEEREQYNLKVYGTKYEPMRDFGLYALN